MAKNSDIITALAQTQDEKIFLARIAEKAEISREQCYLTCTKFLDLYEAEMAHRLLDALGETRGRFWGGHEGAERQILMFLPEWLDEIPIEGEDCPLTAIRCKRHREDTLTHRDYLGSLMGLGLRRDGVGDILVGDHGADIIVLREIAPYLLANYEKAGRKKLQVQEISLSRLIIPEEKVSYIRDTVASMRLDAIVAAMFRLPRAKAADLVRGGKVFVNQRLCERVDKEVSEHDRITLRGTGRGEVDGVLGESKKGRIMVSFKRFG